MGRANDALMLFSQTAGNALRLCKLSSKLPKIHYRVSEENHLLVSNYYPELNQLYCNYKTQLELIEILSRLTNSKRNITIWIAQLPHQRLFSFESWKSETFFGMQRSLVNQRIKKSRGLLNWVIAKPKLLNLAVHPGFGQVFQRSLELRYRLHHLSSGDFVHSVGFLGDTPIASFSIFLSDGEAGIYDVAVHDKYRRKGFASEAIIEAICLAKKRSAKTVTLQTSSELKPLYERLQFAYVDQFTVLHKIV